jgi:hypothetical protein
LEVAVLEQWRLEPAAARRHACEEERERGGVQETALDMLGLAHFGFVGARGMHDDGTTTTKETAKNIDVLWMADGRIRNHFSLFK